MRRWLAREAPRQWFTTAVGLAELVVFLLIVGPPSAAASPLGWLVNWFGAFLLTIAAVYTALTVIAFRGLSGEALRSLAASTASRRPRPSWRFADEVSLAIAGALFAFLVVVMLLVVPSVRLEPMAPVSALATVAAAWVTILLGFAARYLRAWAVDASIDFPEERSEVEFSDFIFLAVQISTAYAPEVAALRTAAVRRTATAHNVLAFVFNSVIVALLVTVALPTVV